MSNMSGTGKSGSGRALLVGLLLVLGAAGGFWVGKDRFFGENAPAGPDMRGGSESAGSTTFEPEIPAPDEIPVDEEPGAWAAEQKAWLAENAKKDGVTVTESGLQYRILSESGQNDKPHATDIVQVHYRGSLTDGVEFDSSYNYGEPAEFPLNEVIAGWTEGVQLMSVGDIYEFTIPSELGYGARGAGGEIPGYSVLIFEVELLDIIRP